MLTYAALGSPQSSRSTGEEGVEYKIESGISDRGKNQMLQERGKAQNNVSSQVEEERGETDAQNPCYIKLRSIHTPSRLCKILTIAAGLRLLDSTPCARPTGSHIAIIAVVAASTRT